MIAMDKVHELMQEEVTRKEFLRYVGIALLSLVGVANLLQSINHVVTPSVTRTNKVQSSGYGVSAYGR
jgi:TRAP-type mannitol/chloroaromatic compound transport system permease small subunit